MQYALAVPTQIGQSRPGSGGLRRLSIQADAATVDLVLSAAMPIGSLIPPIVDVLSPQYRLSRRSRRCPVSAVHSGRRSVGLVEDIVPIRDSRWYRAASDLLVDRIDGTALR